MFKELDRVVLTADFPEYRLRAGYEIEVFTVDGKTYDIITVNDNQVRPIGHLDIAHARPLE